MHPDAIAALLVQYKMVYPPNPDTSQHMIINTILSSISALSSCPLSVSLPLSLCVCVHCRGRGAINL